LREALFPSVEHAANAPTGVEAFFAWRPGRHETAEVWARPFSSRRAWPPSSVIRPGVAERSGLSSQEPFSRGHEADRSYRSPKGPRRRLDDPSAAAPALWSDSGGRLNRSRRKSRGSKSTSARPRPSPDSRSIGARTHQLPMRSSRRLTGSAGLLFIVRATASEDRTSSPCGPFPSPWGYRRFLTAML
jgi:hypothetical protein